MAISNLNQELRLLVNPRDYFYGLRLGHGFCPDNLLMFSRTSPVGLRGPTELHPRHMLIVAARGSVTVLVDGQHIELQAGCGLLVFPFQSHSYANLQEPLLLLFATFTTANDQLIGELRNQPFRLPADERKQLGHLVAHYRQHVGDPEQVLELVVKLRRFLLDCRQWQEPIQPVMHDQAALMITDIKAFVDGHLPKGVRIKAMAEHFGISESTLANKFRKQIGSSLGQYIQRLRLNQAVILLVSNHVKIQDVAKLSGFESSFAFGRAFRRVFKITPLRYRQHYQRLMGKITSGPRQPKGS